MLTAIVIVSFAFLYFTDYNKIKTMQTKKQNGFYLFIFFSCFILTIAYILNVPIPKISTILRSLLK